MCSNLTVKTRQTRYLFHCRTFAVKCEPIQHSLREKCPYSKFFWSVFSRIQTKYEEIPRNDMK